MATVWTGYNKSPEFPKKKKKCRHCQLHMHLVHGMRNDCGLAVDCRSDNRFVTEYLRSDLEITSSYRYLDTQK